MLLRCELNQYFLKEVYMKKTITLSLVFFFIGIQTIMALSPLFLEEIEKDGPCPPGWNSYGSYCVVANSNAKPSVTKYGSCPSGWNTHGNYCVAQSNNVNAIVPKYATCPSGWNSYGSYCVAGNSAKPIIPKSGSCPSGWNSHGGWCVKN